MTDRTQSIGRVFGASSIALMVGAVVTATPTHANEEVELSFIPGSEADCESLYEQADTPEETLGAFIASMVAYEDDNALGIACLTMGLDETNLQSGSAYDGKEPIRAFMYLVDVGIKKDPNIARSYFLGATPENGYALPEDSLTLNMSRNRLSNISETEVRVFVETSGQPTARPARLHKNGDGDWKIHEASSLFVGIYKPSGG